MEVGGGGAKGGWDKGEEGEGGDATRRNGGLKRKGVPWNTGQNVVLGNNRRIFFAQSKKI